MKRIKIMLLSLALFAVIGGALAFKFNPSNVPYCTKAPVNGSCAFTCPTLINNSTIDPLQAGPLVCTTPSMKYTTVGGENDGCWYNVNYPTNFVTAGITCGVSTNLKAD